MLKLWEGRIRGEERNLIVRIWLHFDWVIDTTQVHMHTNTIRLNDIKFP